MLDLEFKKKLESINPTITALEEYAGSNTKLLCSCNVCGNTWSVTPSHLFQGRGCPICSKKRGTSKRRKSNETFTQEVHSANSNIELLTPYSGSHNKVGCRCKICGYEWSGRPDHLIKGIGCPKCAGNARKTTLSFIDEMKALHPNIEIIGEYLSADEKVECKCMICKNTWKAVPNSLLSGSGCPHCFKRYKTSFSEQAMLFYIKKYYSNAIGTYIKDGIEFDIYIQKSNTAIEYDGAYWHRNRLEHDNLKDNFAANNEIRLIRIREHGLKQTISAINIFREGHSEENLTMCIVELLKLLGIDSPYVNLKADRIEILNCYYSKLKSGSLAETNPMLTAEWHPTKNMEVTPDMVSPNSGKKFWWKCSVCGFEWEASLDHRSNGRGCPSCSKNALSNKRSKTHEQFVREICELNTEIIVLGTYINSRIPILCKCNICNNEFSITPHDILQGRKCPYCTKNERILKSRKKTAVFLQEIANINPYLEILDPYTTAKHPIKCKCKKCGYVWETIPDRLLKGAGCPACAGKVAIVGKNDLATLNPQLASEWNTEKNGDLTPQMVLCGSNKKVWWKCRNGHEWQARICSRNYGSGCPECARQKHKKP